METFRKTIKKIAALTGGAVMVGAAMAGAFAALDTLPQPFVSSAGVMDSYVVVGTMGWNPNAAFNAASTSGLAEDLATGIDVGAAFAQKATSAAKGTGAATTISEGTLLSVPGAVIGYNEDIDMGAPTGLTAKDLPVILKDGKFKESKGDTVNDENYEQTITLDPDAGDTGTVVFDKNTDKDAGTYVFFDKGDNIYEYKLEFDNPVEYVDGDEDADFDNVKIVIQGRTYTVSGVTADVGGLSQIELLSGAVTATQGEYTTQTYTVDGKSYEVEVLIVSDTGDVAKFKINGETTDAMAVGDTYELSDGMEIGVEELLPNEGSEAAGADQVTFYLGAQKLELNDAGEVKVNGETLDDYTTDVALTTTATTWSDMTIDVSPDKDIYLGEGGVWVDPVFGQWEIAFTEMVKDTEEFALDVTGGDTGTLTFDNNNGDKIELPLIVSPGETEVAWGENSDYIDGVLANGEGTDAAGTSTNEGMTFVATHACEANNQANMEDNCDGYLFLAISANNEARLYSITNIDATAKTFDIIDEQTGDTIEEDASCDSGDVVDITGMGSTFEFDCETAADTFQFEVLDLSGTGDMETSLGANIFLTQDDDTALFDVEDANGNSDQTTIDHDGSGDMTADVAGVTWIAETEDSNVQMALDASDWGVIYTNSDKDNDNDITISYPEEIKDNSGVSAQVYIAPASATTATSSSGAVNINYINAATGIAKTDADFATSVPTKNVILIGGPVVNELVSELATAGKTYTSTEWATMADKAIVQTVEDAYGTYDALVIAGYESKDTKLAGKVVASKLLQNQFSDKLKGQKVTLGTAGASTVNEVTFA